MIYLYSGRRSTKMKNFYNECELSLYILVILFFVSHTQAAAPVFSGLPNSVTIGEAETNDRLIYTLTVSDADNDPFNCDIASTTPASAPFRVLKDTDTGKFGVYTFNPTPGATMFNIGTTSLYTLTVRCDDNNGNTPTAVLSVDIFDNDKLEFTNLPATVTFVASTTVSGATIYDVDYSHALTHDTITFSMTALQTTSLFQIDPSTGVITLTRDLKFESNAGVDLFVTVSDTKLSVVGRLKVIVTQLNYVPEFLNTVSSIDVLENIASGTLLTTLTSYDKDAGAILTYSMSVTPTADTAKFTFNTANLQLSLSAGQTFDYETRTSYTLNFTIFDTMATSVPYILTVNIVNVNEACYFDKSIYYVSLTEANIGASTFDPGFVVKDYDGASTYTLSFLAANNSNRFSIGSTTGVISFDVNYDVDNGAMPTSVVLTCVCTDSTGETGTTLVYITVNDANDNAPTFPQSSYVLYVDQLTSAGSLLGSITPTDADSSTNGEFTCSAVTTSTLTNAYYSVGADCGIYLITNPSGSLNYGQTIRFIVTATDKGSSALSSSTTVDVIFRETTTTTTTTTAAPDTNAFWNDPGSVAVFCISLILGLLLAAALLYLCLRFCYTGFCCGPDPFDFCNCCSRDCCRPSSRSQRRVVNEKPSSRKDEFNFRREDTISDFGGKRVEEPRRTPMIHGPREFKDFPQSQSSRLTPTDVRIAYPMAVVPRGYY